jgi:hypothetical protein
MSRSSRRSAAAHARRHSACWASRLQFWRSAAVAPSSESSCQPATCRQLTAVNRPAARSPAIIGAPPGGAFNPDLTALPPPHDASNTAVVIERAHPAHAAKWPGAGMKRIQCSFLMRTAMSDLFDEYPMLIFALESVVALFLLVFIVWWTASGKKKNQSSDPARRR